jgi:hypothetical protein
MSPARHQAAVPLLEVPLAEIGHQVWHMKDELGFIRGLGHWRNRSSVPDRAQLLRGYLAGLALRSRWTNLEREALECEARAMLRQVERRKDPRIPLMLERTGTR